MTQAAASEFQDFHDLLNDFAAFDAIATEDVLGALTPLMRQVADIHDQRRVAPVDGVEALRVDRGRLWFESSKALEPKRNIFEISRLQGMDSALDIADADDELRFELAADDPEVLVAAAETKPETPLYLAGYRAWEHAVGHHDPVTDIFSLGIIGASLATGLDFTETAELKRFVTHRETLTQLNRRLHPVVADLLSRMTELDRRLRPQDLRALIHALETHRRTLRPGASAPEPEKKLSRTEKILTELRSRLYDLSRRNRLLFHKPDARELNVTEASSPIVLRPEAIRPEQLAIWSGAFAERLASQEQFQLSEFIRFDEAVYAPSVLDKLRIQARKDRTEFGFSQLRMVLCFLRWRNLRDAPEDPISSPLLLAPVELKKRRGATGGFDIQATAAEAEVNPSLRRLLNVLYQIELPASVPLDDLGAVKKLHESLAEQMKLVRPSVHIEYIDTPAVRQIHERAARRVDLYKKRRPTQGLGLKKFGALSYSYARESFQPLGEQLYTAFVAPAPAPKGDPRASISKASASAEHMAPQTAPSEAAKPQSPPDLADVDEGAFRWAMDCCSVTLANFNYRKMSLVRDFDALIEGGHSEGGETFERVFSSKPRPLPSTPQIPAAAERHQIVVSDPTQDAAVYQAREGASYVIQGPPGTGKSQTIANLIADFIGQGKRVLFVCDKRAALDVVYHRLQSSGLHRLCALVHDSQEDKRGFVQDLKDLYEDWMVPPANGETSAALRETGESAAKDIRLLQDFTTDMRAASDGEPAYKMIARAAVSRGRPGARLNVDDRTRLPRLSDWRAGREAAMSVEAALRRMTPEPILAKHPARFVAAAACADPNLFERLTQAIDAARPAIAAIREAEGLTVWEEGGAPPLGAMLAQIDYAARLAPVAAARKLAILTPGSFAASSFASDEQMWRDAVEAHERTQGDTTIWVDKLSAIETESALEVALRQEGKFFSFFSSAWKEVKKEVIARTHLADLKIKPRFTDILNKLYIEHQAEAEVQRLLRQLGAQIGLKDGDEARKIVAEREAGAPEEGPHAAALMKVIADNPDAGVERVQTLAKLKGQADAVREALNGCFSGVEMLGADAAQDALNELDDHRDSLPAFAPALRALADAPIAVRSALRQIELPVEVIEDEIVNTAVERALATRPGLLEMSGARIDEAGDGISDRLAMMRRLTAKRLIEDAQRRFIENISLTQALELELDEEGRARKEVLQSARRDLERELNKTARFRSVRELMEGPAGVVIRDLKPIWLMSPLSVADALPLKPEAFDVAIFDEASQVPLEDAAPTLYRAPQVIVVGDEKQLPPTNFFGGAASDEDASDDEPELSIDLDAQSFLGQAAKTLPSTLLGWHYRSRSEELIAFSNAVFYAGKLISIPAVTLTQQKPAIEAQGPQDGAKQWKEILARPISFHHTPFAIYDRTRNRGEAEYIAVMVRGLLMKRTGQSIGIVAFSEAQQTEIERALDKMAERDVKFRDLYEAEQERQEDGQFAGLFVKNLENVQGDERDIIIVSVCYAPDKTGRMRMNFGPINRAGGEKRLNVIFSRAKKHIALISTIKADAVTNDFNTGALCLKTYLRYAEAVSVGDRPAMERALASVAPHSMRRHEERRNEIAERIAERLRERGYEVETALGASNFICDLAVRRPSAKTHELAVLVDGPQDYNGADPVERHVTKRDALRAFGWRVLSVLALDWRNDPEAVVGRIERALSKKN